MLYGVLTLFFCIGLVAALKRKNGKLGTGKWTTANSYYWPPIVVLITTMIASIPIAIFGNMFMAMATAGSQNLSFTIQPLHDNVYFQSGIDGDGYNILTYREVEDGQARLQTIYASDADIIESDRSELVYHKCQDMDQAPAFFRNWPFTHPEGKYVECSDDYDNPVFYVPNTDIEK